MKKFLGFTLAEILITVGIIGGVAVLTIPVMTAKFSKKILETKLVKIYSAIKQVEKMPGKSLYKAIKNGADLCEDYFEPYMHGTCIDPPKLKYKYLNCTPVAGEPYCSMYIYPSIKKSLLLDDETLLIPRARSLYIVFNYDGGSKLYTAGRDVFELLYDYDKKGYFPDDIDKTLRSYIQRVGLPNYCTKYIYDNNWKIPEDYPVTF